MPYHLFVLSKLIHFFISIIKKFCNFSPTEEILHLSRTNNKFALLFPPLLITSDYFF